MKREQVGRNLMDMVEAVGQKVQNVSWSSYAHAGQRAVTVVVLPTDRWIDAKDALEDVFGALHEEVIR